MSKAKLKPCPFCGGKAKLIWFNKHSIYTYWVVCEGCKAKTLSFLSKETAVQAWNKRANNDG